MIEYKSKTYLDPMLSPRLNVGPPFPFFPLSFYLTAHPPCLSVKSSYLSCILWTLRFCYPFSRSVLWFFLRLSDFPLLSLLRHFMWHRIQRTPFQSLNYPSSSHIVIADTEVYERKREEKWRGKKEHYAIIRRWTFLRRLIPRVAWFVSTGS